MKESLSLNQIDIEQITCPFEEIIHSQKDPVCSSCKQNLLKCTNCSKFILSKTNNIQTSVVIQIGNTISSKHI